MKRFMKTAWMVISGACVVLVLALAVALIAMQRSGALSKPRLEVAGRALKGEPIYARQTDDAELQQAVTDFEERQRNWSRQTLRREEDLKNLAAVVENDLRTLRDDEEALRAERAAFEKDKTAWEAARGPAKLTEAEAARRRTLKSIRDMAPAEQVKVLVRLPDAELVEMMKLFKGEAGELWPLLQQDDTMKKTVAPNRTRFDVIWEEFNKPTPLPKPTE